MEYHQRSKQTMDPRLMGKNLKHIPEALHRIKNNHTIMAPRQCCHRKIYETNWKTMKTTEIEGKNWRQELQRFLLQYRSTPHGTTKVAPCELLFNRKNPRIFARISKQGSC